MEKLDRESEGTLVDVLELCSKLGRAALVKEVQARGLIGCSKTLKNVCQAEGYENYYDFCRKNGYKTKGDVVVGGIVKHCRNLTVEELVILWHEFRDEFERHPNSTECNDRIKKQYNLPDWDNLKLVLSENNVLLDEFYDLVGQGSTTTKSRSYDYYVEKYITVSNQKGDYLKSNDLINNKHRLPSGRWFVSNCPDKDVITFNQFVEWCGFIPYQGVSMDAVRSVIYRMQKQMDRPLEYDDFRNPLPSEVGISFINKYWGSLNKMKEALGLEIVQEDMMSKQISKDEMLILLQEYINEIQRLPLCREIDTNPNMPHSGTYHRYFGGLNKAFIRLGYTPNKKSIALGLTDQEIREIYLDFIVDLGSTPTYELCSMVYELPHPHTVLRRFDCTWNEFITSLGFVPNEQKIINTCYAKDGSLCLSASERIVHNYLLSNGVKNIQKEVLYKDFLTSEPLQEGAGLKRCDWLFYHKEKLYIVEYFGLMGFKSYNERRDDKINLIHKDGLSENFIALYPSDLSRLDDVFSFLQ